MALHKGQGTTVRAMRELFYAESKRHEAAIRAKFADQYDDYKQLFREIEDQRKNKEWAANEQVYLASLVFEQPVYVYSYNLSRAHLFFGHDTARAGSSPILLSFERGNHYNLLLKSACR